MLIFAMTVAYTMMNCFVAHYFLLVVKYNWSNKEISQRRERWWYASVVCLATVPPITAAAYDRIHTSETVLLCMVASGPSGCSYDNEGECNTSQDTVGAISAYIAILTVLIFAVASFCLTFTVFRTVRAKFASSARFSFQGSTNEGASEQVRIVRNKCVLYSLGYLNTFLPVLFSAIVSEVFFTEDADNQEFNALIYSNQLLAWFFMPLQGCFNALVYFEWLPCLKKRKTKRDSDKTASATTLSTTASATAAVAEDVEYVQNT